MILQIAELKMSVRHNVLSFFFTLTPQQRNRNDEGNTYQDPRAFPHASPFERQTNALQLTLF